jgi:hypothetical protein
MVVTAHPGAVAWRMAARGDDLTLSTASLRVRVNEATGAVRFLDRESGNTGKAGRGGLVDVLRLQCQWNRYRHALIPYALLATYTVLADSLWRRGFGKRTMWAVVAAKTVLSAAMKSSSGGSSDQRAKMPSV